MSEIRERVRAVVLAAIEMPGLSDGAHLDWLTFGAVVNIATAAVRQEVAAIGIENVGLHTTLEAMRRQLGDAREDMANARHLHHLLVAERDRLRAALEECAHELYSVGNAMRSREGDFGGVVEAYVSDMTKVEARARAALGSKP